MRSNEKQWCEFLALVYQVKTVLYLGRANEFRCIMSSLNHKMKPHEPAGHKLLNTKERMLINNIF